MLMWLRRHTNMAWTHQQLSATLVLFFSTIIPHHRIFCHAGTEFAASDDNSRGERKRPEN